jgi:hypothetical protein
MPLRHARRSTTVTVDRDFILDCTLSPLSKLLHLVLLCLPDDDEIDMEQAAVLVGVGTSAALEPHVAELEAAGFIEIDRLEGEPIMTLR